MLRGAPLATLKAPGTASGGQRQDVRAGDVAHVDEVAQLPAVLEHAWGAPGRERAREDRRDAGVRRVPRHPGSVDVVVAQRRHGHPGLAAERRREMLLVKLRRGVDVARVAGRILGDAARLKRRAALRAGRFEATRGEVYLAPRRRHDEAVLGTRVASLAVDDHARREHEPAAEARACKLAQQDGGSEVVVGGVVGDVADVGPEADHRGLVANMIDAVQRGRDGGAVAHVAVDELGVGSEVVGSPTAVSCSYLLRSGAAIASQPSVAASASAQPSAATQLVASRPRQRRRAASTGAHATAAAPSASAGSTRADRRKSRLPTSGAAPMWTSGSRATSASPSRWPAATTSAQPATAAASGHAAARRTPALAARLRMTSTLAQAMAVGPRFEHRPAVVPHFVIEFGVRAS